MLQFKTLWVVSGSKLKWCIKNVRSKNFPAVIKKKSKKPQKSDRKTGIFMPNSFPQNQCFFVAVIAKQITVNT